MTKIGPQPGAQSAFLSSSADIAIYGGARGGGKSYALLLEALRHVHRPGFRAMGFRRTTLDIRKPGGLWDKSTQLFPHLKGRARDALLEWRFPSGAWVKFNHLERESSVDDHQGAEYPLILADELTHFSKRQIDYLLMCNRSTCGVRPYFRASCNPDPRSWVKKFVRWWLDDEGRFARRDRAGKLRWFVVEDDERVWASSVDELRDKLPHRFKRGGKVALSATFIPALLEDNPALTESDPGYRAKLEAMPLVERKRMLEGDWLIVEGGGNRFRVEWFPIIDRPRALPGARRVRFWDLAGSARRRSDHSAGALMAKAGERAVDIEDLVNVKCRPEELERTLRATAERDGPGVEIWIEQEVGAAGELLIDNYRRHVLPEFEVHGYVVRGQGDKVARSGPMSAAAERGEVALVRGEWVGPFLDDAQGFPGPRKDDSIDAACSAYNVLQEPDLAYASC